MRQMAEQRGAEVSIWQQNYPGDRHRSFVKVSGGQVSRPIVTTAMEKSEELATAKAVRKMLRHPSFKDQTAYKLPHTIYEEMHPMVRLKRKAGEKGWQLETSHEPIRRGYRELHQLTLTMTNQEKGEILSFESVAPTLQRAEDDAATKALLEMHWARSIDKPLSWVSDAELSAIDKRRECAKEGVAAG